MINELYDGFHNENTRTLNTKNSALLSLTELSAALLNYKWGGLSEPQNHRHDHPNNALASAKLIAPDCLCIQSTYFARHSA